MLKNLKSYLAGFVSCAVLIVGVGAVMAETGDVAIKGIIPAKIKMMLNGQQWKAVDPVTGKAVLPISYNGIIYLPAKNLVGDALKMGYLYEVTKTDKTVWIGGKTGIVPVKSTSQYADYYGTVLTTDTTILPKPDGGFYRWGITNTKPATMETFGGTFSPAGKYSRFRTELFVDETANMPVVFNLLKEERNGLVLSSITVNPGETQVMDVNIQGANKLVLLADINIGHDEITKLGYGEPVFYNGVWQPSGTVKPGLTPVATPAPTATPTPAATPAASPTPVPEIR